MAFGVGAAAAPGHGALGAAARTRRGDMRELARVSSAAGLPLTAGTDALLRAHLPPTPEPLGSSAVPPGRGPQRHGGPQIRPTGIPPRAPPPGKIGPAAAPWGGPPPAAHPPPSPPAHPPG